MKAEGHSHLFGLFSIQLATYTGRGTTRGRPVEVIIVNAPHYQDPLKMWASRRNEESEK